MARRDEIAPSPMAAPEALSPAVGCRSPMIRSVRLHMMTNDKL